MDQGKFYWNDWGAVGHALGDVGLEWSREVTHPNIQSTGPEPAFAKQGQYILFGFSPENPEQGGHFHAYNRAGEELWVSEAPSDGKHNFPIDATISGDIAVVGARQKGGQLDGEQDPLVWGIDVDTGEELWAKSRDEHEMLKLGYVGSHDGDIYLGWGGGTKVLNKTDGTVIDSKDSWSITYAAWGGSTGHVHGETLFACAPQGVHAYPIGTNGLEWSYSDTGWPDAPLAVDNSLVVAAADEGDIYALERESGEERWTTSITGAVRAIDTSASHVWVGDRETGLTGYDRSTGEIVHRSTQPLDGEDIAVASDELVIGGDTVTGYSINF
ncbi:outer membrane protein assembly factor BamB family protein [Halonotius aquaticus]|uniref:outer membrane protein assembly factor BamB family protein n=1 Tax=Halonotius aquaticus TaxID=2216978 RepID=UPI0014027E1B|nr:PQQ-binding-like beta-propeller repeat protein [Halonotius aquaticus]